jgi:hypothetical protein
VAWFITWQTRSWTTPVFAEMGGMQTIETTPQVVFVLGCHMCHVVPFRARGPLLHPAQLAEMMLAMQRRSRVTSYQYIYIYLGSTPWWIKWVYYSMVDTAFFFILYVIPDDVGQWFSMWFSTYTFQWHFQHMVRTQFIPTSRLHCGRPHLPLALAQQPTFVAGRWQLVGVWLKM